MDIVLGAFGIGTVLFFAVSAYMAFKQDREKRKEQSSLKATLKTAEL
jgi:hypothetical protein